jgi:hypothetical protein
MHVNTIFTILIIHALLSVLCDKLAQKTANIETPFHFLVQGENIYISNKIVTETIEYQVVLNFSLSAWTQIVVDLNDRFRNFENLKFFSDDDLKGEFLSYTSTGFYGLTNAEKLGTFIMKHKNESKPHVPANCLKILSTWNVDEISRFRVNLDYRFSYINTDWETQFVKSSTEAQETLLSWITLFNEGCAELYQSTQKLIEILELLNDGNFPNFLLGEDKTCKKEGNSLEGENFQIINCSGHKEGFSCTVLITQPIEFLAVQNLINVAYSGMELHGRYVRTSESKEIMRIECEELKLVHPVCELHKLPQQCRFSLQDNHIDQIIDFCNFTKVMHPTTYAMTTNGGVLIQQGVDTITANSQPINENPPILLYSNGKITINKNNIQMGIYPESTVTSNIIVKSAVTELQISKLSKKLYWEEWKEEIDAEEVTDLVLILIELITLPFILFGFIQSCKKKKIRDIGREKVDKRRIYKQNMTLLRKK